MTQTLAARIAGNSKTGDATALMKAQADVPFVSFAVMSLVPSGRPDSYFDSQLGDSLVAAVQAHFADVKPPSVIYWRQGPWFDQTNTTEGLIRRAHCRCLIASAP